MPMVEYFDRASGTKKRKEFAYSAVGKENFRKFKEEQDAFAKAHGHAKPKVTHPVKSNRMDGEGSITAKKTNKGMGTPETKEDREKRYQDFDEKEIDKNRPSEKKTKKPEKEVKYIKLNEDDRYHKKIGARSGLDHGRIPGY